MKKLWELYVEFLKIGLFTIGGGLAMLPLMRYVAVEKKKWISEDEIVDCVALCQSVPGVIAVNMSTYIGYRLGKLKGAVSATAGVITPSVVIITIIAIFLSKVNHSSHIDAVLTSMKATSAALIFYAAIILGRKVIADKITALIAVGSFVSVVWLNAPAYIAIIFGTVVGVVAGRLRK